MDILEDLVSRLPTKPRDGMLQAVVSDYIDSDLGGELLIYARESYYPDEDAPQWWFDKPARGRWGAGCTCTACREVFWAGWIKGGGVAMVSAGPAGMVAGAAAGILLALVGKSGVEKALVCTYQAISGAGRTFETWPEIIDNVIPYIGGEEEKSEQEPMKLWGHIEGDKIVNATEPNITAQCLRVPVSDGHMAACFVSFKGEKPSLEQIKADWAAFSGRAQELKLPSAPRQFLHYFEEADRPQTKLDRMLEGGMAVSIGRLRPDTQYDYKFVCLSHNTLRGAAGGAVLLAELLCAEGYITRK